MSALQSAALTVTAPLARSTADATHEHGLIFRVANSTSSGQATAADIPRNCRGRYWRFFTRGANVQWAFVGDEDGIGGVDTAPTLVYDQLSATGTGSAVAAGTLVDGSPEHFYCPANARRVVFISSAATGFFEAQLSGDKVR
jgi:hypothetical protein